MACISGALLGRVMERCACDNGAQSPDKTAVVCKKEEVKKKGMFLPFFKFSIHSTNRSAP